MARLAEATDEAVADAARRLQSGQVVAFPTETVYGLGADTFNPSALEAVYRLKGRPPDNPLIAHVDSAAQAQQVAERWDDRCQR
ncbi:MAG: L-threonylcarbamoyladenylate synthase, partial [Planctomycetota bacterium]